MLEIDWAEGCYLYDPSGKKYFDLISGIAVSNLGHGNKHVLNAISEQSSKYLHLMVYGEYISYPQLKLAQRLSDHLPSDLNNVYFVNSGSEAIEGAIKLAKRATARTEIISFKNAYHGSTSGALSIMGGEFWKNDYRPLMPDVKQIEFNQFDDLSEISERTAAVVVEVVQGEAGVRIPEEGFLQALRERCDEWGVLLVFDEVQTGIGRTGRLFAFEHYGVIPDVLCLSKALGAGLPLGAFIANKKLMQTLADPALGHITTFGGHALCCAAALAGFDWLISQSLIERVAEKEALFLNLLKHQEIKTIRSKGLMMAVELKSSDKVQKFIQLLLVEGVITDWFLFADDCFRIAPPLIITKDQIVEVCDKILEVLNRL